MKNRCSVVASFFQQLTGCGSRNRLAEEEALTSLNSGLKKTIALSDRLNTLGGEFEIHRAGQHLDSADESPIGATAW